LTEQTWAEIDVVGCTTHACIYNRSGDGLSAEGEVDGLAAEAVVVWVSVLILLHDVG